MKITITGCKLTPKWETLETIIQEATNDDQATIISIAKNSGSACDYRAPGEYSVAVRRGRTRKNEGKTQGFPVTVTVEE